MAKKNVELKNIKSVYGTELVGAPVKSNHPVRSKYVAAFLAIVFGMLGLHHFYLRNIVRGLIELILTVLFVVLAGYLFHAWYLLSIPFAIGVLQGVIYLTQSDAGFCKSNHVRVI